MLMRTLLIGILAVVAVSAQPPGPPPHGRGPGGPGARFLGAEAGMPGRVVKNAPYSADVLTESTQTLADGSHVRQSNTMHVYRDSEGRTRREETLRNLNGLAVGASGSSAAPQVVFINDPVAGANYALDATHKAATKSVWNPQGRGGPGGRAGQAGLGRGPGGGANPAARVRGQNAQNVKTESLGQQTIEGVQATGTRTTLTIPAGQIGNEEALQVVTETWYSTDLQTVVMRKRSDPRSGEVTTRLANVNRSEPPSTLFEVPADFTVSTVPHHGPAAARQ
jgi:hypothetical protein